MSVYVDVLMNHGWRLRGHYVASCHMYADTQDELHAMAKAIGMKVAWYQIDASMPHYDLTASRRKAAVELGAIEHGRREMVTFMRKWRSEVAPRT